MRDGVTGPLAAAALFLAAGPAAGFPDATPWDQDCQACHYETLREGAPNLMLDGFPETAPPGSRHDLTISLSDPRMRRAGFRLVITGCAGATGTLIGGGKVETEGAMARTTYDGTTLPKGVTSAAWTLTWQAPADTPTGCRLTADLQANAANDDLSPLGDVIYVMEDETEVTAGP